MSAVLYIVMGVPLYLCWISVFIVILAVSVLVISGEITFWLCRILQAIVHSRILYPQISINRGSRRGGLFGQDRNLVGACRGRICREAIRF